MSEPRLRLAELLAALSLAADLGNGVPMETTLRICILATRLALDADATRTDVAATYYTGLLWSAGCTSTAHEERIRFGDDIGLKRAMTGADFERPTDVLRRAVRIGAQVGARGRVHGLAGLVRYGRAHGVEVAASHCEAGARLADRLGLSEPVLAGLGAFFEYWNGHGGPAHLTGNAIPFAARAARLALEAVYAHRAGADAAAVVGGRAGRELDPELVGVFQRGAGALLDGLDDESVWSAALELEPEPRPGTPSTRLDALSEAFADFVDLKSVYWLGHSRAVARLAQTAAEVLRMPDEEVVHVRRSSHVHGLGRVAISNRIWDNASAFSAGEWERVRLYPYFTDRVLCRAPVLADFGRTASGAQERLDGSGYHRGLPAAAQPMAVRVLAAAAAYQSMTEVRPQRPALTAQRAAAELRAAAAAGRLDGDAVSAVLDGAGHPSRRREWPASLTDREVEVLRLVAVGHSNRQVAASLTISEETARNHVKHIYDKIGMSTRAGAALFAMEHGLYVPER